MKKKEYKILYICLSILFLLIILDIYKCPFKLIFGIPCPLCGMTHAIYYALQFKFKLAFKYHLFWPIALLTILLHVLIEFKIINIKKKYIDLYIYFFGSLFIIYYFIRLFN